MKKLFCTLMVAGACLLTSQAVTAQKMAHVSSDSLMKYLPEAKKADSLLAKNLKALETEIGKLQMTYQSLVTQYSEEVDVYTQTIKKDKEAEIQSMQERIRIFQEQAQRELEETKANLYKPIFEKAKKAIEMVAKENNYKYVFDSAMGILLYAEPTEDILPLVKKKLASMPIVVLPGEEKASPNPKPGAGKAGNGTKKP